MTAAEDIRPYSTLEVDDRVQVQPSDQKEVINSGDYALQGKKCDIDGHSHLIEGSSALEVCHHDHSAWAATEPAALEAYHPSWNPNDEGIIPVHTSTASAEPLKTLEDVTDLQGGEKSNPPSRRRICGLSPLVFSLLLVLAISIIAGTLIGALVGTRATHNSHKTSASMSSVASTSASATISATSAPSSTTTATSTSAPTIPTNGANITNCNQNSFVWYPALGGKCNEITPKQGFELIALGKNCTVTHFSDFYCSKNATASTLYHCYDLIKSFTVDNCD